MVARHAALARGSGRGPMLLFRPRGNEMATRAVTVCVPAYNEVASLEGTISDVLAATASFSDCEIIVVDDGSTDGTGELADALAVRSAGVRVLHNPTNLGFAVGY